MAASQSDNEQAGAPVGLPKRDGKLGRTGQDRKSGSPKMNVNPDWAMGLRQLYNSVVDEELPDSFSNLLAQLDKAD